VSRPVERATEWLYRGLWAVLVEGFRVPSTPPTLPPRPGQELEQFGPAPGFVSYLKFWFWLGLTAMDGLLLAGWLGSFFVSWKLGAALAPVFLAVAVLPDVVAYVAIHLRYDTTWYVLDERSLRIRRGIWTLSETTTTFENVQNVRIEQGPVQRWYGIASVIVETAGGGGATGPDRHHAARRTHVALIEGVADAPRIRERIMARVRSSRSAGLGDERAEGPRKPAARGVFGPDHVAVLREIRDITRGL
jgi:membrane protein YdbS with pleckstrin-like domain